MNGYELVVYAPRSPRRWEKGVQRGTDTVAEQLAGPGVQAGRVARLGYVLEWPSPMLGLNMFGRILVVAWSGTWPMDLRWDRLQVDPECERFQVSFRPEEDAAEMTWRSAAGEMKRHVLVHSGEVVIDEGDARVCDDEADSDPSIRVESGTRLPPKVVAQLLQAAEPDDVTVFDGRRYVRTEDRAILAKARIVRQSERGVRWVAVDQTGPVNTLLDPLARPVDGRESRKLADRTVSAWFGFRLSPAKLRDLPPMRVYTPIAQDK